MLLVPVVHASVCTQNIHRVLLGLHELVCVQDEYDQLAMLFFTFDQGEGKLSKAELQRLCKYMNYPYGEVCISLYHTLTVDKSAWGGGGGDSAGPGTPTTPAPPPPPP